MENIFSSGNILLFSSSISHTSNDISQRRLVEMIAEQSPPMIIV